MTRRRRRLLILASVAAVTIGSLAVGVETLLPWWLRGACERLAEQVLGRKLEIDGTFDLSLSLTPTLVAEDVLLANAAWGSEPHMVRVSRLRVSVDFRSLLARPVQVRNLEIDGARVLLETDDEGRGNWVFERTIPPAPAPAPAVRAGPLVVLHHASIRDLEWTRRARPDSPALRFRVERLEARLEPASRMIDLDAAGAWNDAPWDVSGRLGTFERLYELRDVEHSVSGRVGDTTVAIRGRIRDPLALGGPDLEAELDGPDIAAALANFGIVSPVSGPFQWRSRISPADEGVGFDVTVGLVGATAEAVGQLVSLLDPERIDATLAVSGPDARATGERIGIGGVPRGPFSIAGRVRRDGPRFRVDDVNATIGGTSLAMSGTIAGAPRAVGTDLTVAASGSNLSELSEITHVRLPAGPFRLGGRFLRGEEALAVEDVEIRTGDSVVRVAGTIGEPPRLANLDLTVDAAGADLSRFSGIATIELPRERFELRGRVARRNGAVALDGVEGRLGNDSIVLAGRLVPVKHLVGSDVDARLAGPDLGKSAALLGQDGLPREPYELSGRVRRTADGYEVSDVVGRVGRISATLGGRLGARPAEGGTALDFRAEGSTLADLAAWGIEIGLPDDPFRVSGRLRIDDRLVHAETVEASVGADEATVDGTLGPLPDTSSLDVAIEVAGHDLSALGRFVAASGGEPPRRVPSEPYRVSGRVRRVPAGLELREVRATIGGTEIRVDGTVGSGEGLLGTDLWVESEAPDSSLFAALSGRAFPDGAFEVRGRVARDASGFSLDAVDASIGANRATISGTVGEPPGFEGTGLDVSVSGPDLAAAFGSITGVSPLPDEPFEASARLVGSVARFVADPLAVRLGDTDLGGRISASFEDRPFFEIDLRSERLRIGRSPEETDGASAAPKRERTIPDEPLALDALLAADARIRIAAADLEIPGLSLGDVVVEGELLDGALRVSRIEGTGRGGGRLTGNLSIEPLAVGYRLRAAGGIAGGRIVLSEATDGPERAPTLDLELSVEGEGVSLHEIAAASDGSALITLGSGRIPNNVSDFMTSGVVRGLLDALNPFRKTSPYTEVECGVVAAEISEGKVTVEPIAARTDRLTITGRGKLDLDTEEIELVWTLKPRRGVGISAGSIANPYIKLGGTLASPSLDAKPLEAAASTGAAVATGGLTLLFRGIYDRITAERKVCLRAIEDAQRKAEEREARGAR